LRLFKQVSRCLALWSTRSHAPSFQRKGYLKLSLVSCAVALYPASTTSEHIRFNTLNRKTGNLVKRQFIDAETGEVVENEDQVRGYEIARGQYIMIEDGELSTIALESTHTINIESFASRSSIDERYLDTPYYIAPDDRVAQEAFAVIRETMRKKKMVGIARVVLQRRERILVSISPAGDLIATESTAVRKGIRGKRSRLRPPFHFPLFTAYFCNAFGGS
jgi:DNA end-binding protein Ku